MREMRDLCKFLGVERLTNDEFLGTQDSNKFPSYVGIYEKLRKYEQLELTPDQVREMSQLYQQKCEEVARLEKRIEELNYIEYGCNSCMFDDERTEYEYPCNECNRLKEDMYSRKVEE